MKKFDSRTNESCFIGSAQKYKTSKKRIAVKVLTNNKGTKEHHTWKENSDVIRLCFGLKNLIEELKIGLMMKWKILKSNKQRRRGHYEESMLLKIGKGNEIKSILKREIVN